MFASPHITLNKNIAAIAIEGSEDGTPSRGVIAQLPKGAELVITGDGFNQRTATVRCYDRSYFVFLQDISDEDEVPL